MGFFEAVGVCFSKYFTFSGRARRPEFFWFVLFNSIASSIASYVDLGLIVAGAIPAFMGGVGPFYVLYLVIALIPTLAVGWRRLHDVGRSGWWSLLPLAVIFVAAAAALAILQGEPNPAALIPLAIGAAVILIPVYILLFVWQVSRSNTGDNAFGPEPVDALAEETSISLPQAVSSAWSQYFKFSGRSRRIEYWWLQAFLPLGAMVALLIDAAISAAFGFPLATPIFLVLMIIPILTMTWRRMHDVGRSGWWALSPTLVMVLAFGVAVFMGASPGSFDPSSGGSVDPIAAIALGVGALIAFGLGIFVFVCTVSLSEKGSNRFGPRTGLVDDVATVFS